MSHHQISIARLSCAALLCFGLLLARAPAQQNQQVPTEASDDVIRVNTELVQTDVMVFDRQGRFVNDLKREQFELRVDGKPQAVSFFELITAGSVNEEAQLAAARGAARPSNLRTRNAPQPLDRGRTVLFYVDDLHLSASSFPRAHDLLLKFVDKEMGQNDEAAITSASGQIGFLQQVTNNRTVLRTAVEKLKSLPISVRDTERPQMSENQALEIEKFDDNVTSYFVDRVLADNPQIPREQAIEMVRTRAHNLLEQASALTNNTLIALERLVRAASPIPGRKLLFFVSDGFILNDNTSDTSNRLRRIADAATRAGVVIYSIDARGLSTGTQDTSAGGGFDPTNRADRGVFSDLTSSQNGLSVLAAETGGRALLNTNAPTVAVTKALQETSVYYLLAWQPAELEQHNGKFRRLEISVKGRPDLIVRVRRGFFDADTRTLASRNNNGSTRTPAKTVEDDLRAALTGIYPASALPAVMSANFVDTPKQGAVMTASMQVDGDALTFGEGADKKQVAAVDLAGFIIDQQGKVAMSFKDHVELSASSTRAAGSKTPDFNYHYRTSLQPGLYQVRMAARDERSGRTGSATGWIEIPDLKSQKLSLSSLLIGERADTPLAANLSPASIPTATMSVSHRLPRNSYLRFITYIYNASRGTNGTLEPDVALQVQVLRDDQPVITTALRKVKTAGISDLARLPYIAEIPLSGMLAGRYVLQVSVIDRTTKTSATQRTEFEIQ